MTETKVMRARVEEAFWHEAREIYAKQRGVWVGEQKGPTGSACDYCGKEQLPMLHGSTGDLIWFACCECFHLCEIGESGVCTLVSAPRPDLGGDELPF